MLLTIKDLARQLQIKPSTLYAWVAARKIPCLKIHGLLRFQQDEIDRWVASFRGEAPGSLKLHSRKSMQGDLNALIARAKGEVYIRGRGKPDQDRAGKEGDYGSV